MTKSSSSSSAAASTKRTKLSTDNKKKPRSAVRVVTCPSFSDFPFIHSTSNSNHRRRSYDDNNEKRRRVTSSLLRQEKKHNVNVNNDKNGVVLDWNDTARQVRALPATALEGKSKRRYQQDEYKRLTGRLPKQQQVPISIVRGIRRKAQRRHAQKVEEAKLHGIVLPTSTTTRQDKDRNQNRTKHHVYGPEPSIGYVNNRGVYRANK